MSGTQLWKRLLFVVAVVAVFAGGIAVGATLPSDQGARAAMAQATLCSNATLNGAFGVHFEGTTRAFGRFASVSLWTFDGAGIMTAEETFNSEQQRVVRTVGGTYQVAPNCTFVLRFPSELARDHEALGICVVVDGGKELTCLDDEEGWVALGIGKKL